MFGFAAQNVDQVFETVVEHPPVGRQVDLRSGVDIAQQLVTVQATAVAIYAAETALGPTKAAHPCHVKLGLVDVGRREDLQCLPQMPSTDIAVRPGVNGTGMPP